MPLFVRLIKYTSGYSKVRVKNDRGHRRVNKLNSSIKMDKITHTIHCPCKKTSYVDDFKATKQVKKLRANMTCPHCKGKVNLLETRTCRCGNVTCISCLDPNEQCDICNGNMDKLWEDPDANKSPEFTEFIDTLKAKRDSTLRAEARRKVPLV